MHRRNFEPMPMIYMIVYQKREEELKAALEVEFTKTKSAWNIKWKRFKKW